MQSQREILKIESLCRQTSKPARTLFICWGLCLIPRKAEAVAASWMEQRWSQCDWPVSPSQVTPGDLFQDSKGTTAHLGCTSFCCPTQRPLPPETAPLMASGEERPPNNTSRLYSASIQWLMVEQDRKQANKKKQTKKQLSYFQEVEDYSFLERKKKRIKTQDC